MDIKRLENIALSDKDVTRCLNNKANLVLYPDLHAYKKIDEILGPYQACVLLFESKPNFGHWCCLWKLNSDTVSFFNPYGGYPDDSLVFIDGTFRKQSNQDIPYLSNLLLDSPYKLTYSEYSYQQHKKDIRTCGRHVIVRLWNRKLTDKQYYNYIVSLMRKLDMTADEVVTYLTADCARRD